MASFLGLYIGWGLGGIDCGLRSCKKGFGKYGFWNWEFGLGLWVIWVFVFLKDWLDWAPKLVVSVLLGWFGDWGFVDFGSFGVFFWVV